MGFMRMFRYIQGVNSEYKEIKMTIPVPTTHIPTSDRMEKQQMCFWLGSKYRDEEPPQPVPGQKVDIRKEKGFNVYVREFPGWAMSDNDYRKEYGKLVKASTLRCGSMHRTTLHLTKDQEETRSGFQSSTVKRVPFFVPAADNTKLITNSNMKPYRESIYHNGG